MLAGDCRRRRSPRPRQPGALRRDTFHCHIIEVGAMTVVYVPRDSSAVSLGADGVAEAIRKEVSSRKLDVKIVRNGSRGMFSHEPMVEVATASGRIAYGPVTASDVVSLFDSNFLD